MYLGCPNEPTLVVLGLLLSYYGSDIWVPASVSEKMFRSLYRYFAFNW